MDREYYGVREALDPNTLSQAQSNAGTGKTMGGGGSQGDG